MKKALFYIVIAVSILFTMAAFKGFDRKLRIFENEEVWFQEYRTEGVVLPDSVAYTLDGVTTIYVPRVDEDSD